MTTEIDEILQVVRIAAAHHRELVELAVDDGIKLVDAIADAGDVLDLAVVIAFLDGVKLFDLFRASKLPVRYITALTEGVL